MHFSQLNEIIGHFTCFESVRRFFTNEISYLLSVALRFQFFVADVFFMLKYESLHYILKTIYDFGKNIGAMLFYFPFLFLPLINIPTFCSFHHDDKIIANYVTKYLWLQRAKTHWQCGSFLNSIKYVYDKGIILIFSSCNCHCKQIP